MHGRRQLVPQGVLLSQATSKICVYYCQQEGNLGWAHCRDCLGNKEEGAGNDGLYAPNLLGYARDNG